MIPLTFLLFVTSCVTPVTLILAISGVIIGTVCLFLTDTRGFKSQYKKGLVISFICLLLAALLPSKTYMYLILSQMITKRDAAGMPVSPQVRQFVKERTKTVP